MGGVEQDGGERGGHDTSVLQTLCCCIVTKCGVVFFFPACSEEFLWRFTFFGRKEGTVTRFMVFIPSSITGCDGTDGWRKMLTLVCRLMYIYTWASIDTTRAFARQALKCCLLSYTLLLAIGGRVLCVV